MIKKEAGFTLIELMVTMVIFVLAIAAASQMFIGQLTQFKQQGKIAETNIEGIIGLELLRRDVAHADLGLGEVALRHWPRSSHDRGGERRTAR